MHRLPVTDFAALARHRRVNAPPPGSGAEFGTLADAIAPRAPFPASLELSPSTRVKEIVLLHAIFRWRLDAALGTLPRDRCGCRSSRIRLLNCPQARHRCRSRYGPVSCRMTGFELISRRDC